MNVRRRGGLKLLGVLAAIVAVAVVGALPPAALRSPAPPDDPRTVRGAYHVHSTRSDGSGSIDEIAAAAARAGLQFVIVTDHGDGTRAPDPPAYRGGVLIIDALEVSTTGGHYVALGLPATPYPLAGTPAAVIEDVRRLGGFGIAAHPGSPRPSLRWQDWQGAFDGIEWINADSEWRDELWGALGRTLLTYAFRGPETLASLLDRPVEVLARWDAAGLQRRVPAIAGADAHARLGFRQRTDPETTAWHVPLPGYEASFRVFSNHVQLARPLTGEAAADAASLLEAIEQGRVFTVIDGLATPGGLEFDGKSASAIARMGGSLRIDDGPATLHAHVRAPAGATLTLFRDGNAVRSSTSGELDEDVTGQPGVYRVEAYIDGGPGRPPVPWLLSNAVYVGLAHAAPATPVEPPARRVPAATAEARAEQGPRDTSTVETANSPDQLAGEPPLVWRFALAGGTPAGQFAAVQIPVRGGLAEFNRVQFEVASEKSIRAWLQLRAPVGNTERWGTTFHADSERRLVTLRLEDFQPIGVTSTERPPLDKVDSLLLVVDTLNSLPGAIGSLTLWNLALVRQ